jgi:hypothetical protein
LGENDQSPIASELLAQFVNTKYNGTIFSQSMHEEIGVGESEKGLWKKR